MIGRISPANGDRKGPLYDFNVNGDPADWRCEHCGRIRSLTRDDIGEHLTREALVRCSDGAFHFHKLVV